MRTFTIEDIRGLNPCYDPSRYLPEDWRGNAEDVLAVEDCPPADRLWVVLREGWIDDRTLRLFAVWCARQALYLIENPDPRSIAACNVGERYANGAASAGELAAARAAARAAASAASDAAAWAAHAAASAASDAAHAAASAASDAAAWAAHAAARAARAAAWAARNAARAANNAANAAWAARDANAVARSAQVAHLREMLAASHE